MPFDIIRQDIVLMDVDVIVSAVDQELSLGSGVNQSIHDCAGVEYSELLRNKGYIRENEVFVTSGYNLKAKHIFHTLTPIWEGGFSSEDAQLIDCYNELLRVAMKMNVQSIAFPLLSSGNHRYPKDKALKIAMSTLQKFVLKHDIQIYLVVFDFTSYFMSLKLSSMVTNYLESNFDSHAHEYETRSNFVTSEYRIEHSQDRRSRRPLSLEEAIAQSRETFTKRLFRYIDERDLRDSDVYRNANIDRRLFSKIRSNNLYQPSKPTVIALAISLKLSLDETIDLLNSAGYALSHSQVFDVIIEYFISHNQYDIFVINQALFYYNLPTLGS
jgi:O-acetyl-ADP-ribose deacetylase